MESKCLVTGGSGLLGSYTSRILGDKLHSNVFNLDSRPFPFDLGQNVKPVQIDITNYSLLSKKVRQIKPDVIIHLAASLTQESNRRPVESFKLNTMSTLNLLDIAVNVGSVKKFIYASSLSMYSCYSRGERIRKKIDENASIYPNNPYTIFKVTSELLGRYYSEKHGFSFISLRFPLIFGYHNGATGGSFQRTISNVIRQGREDKVIRYSSFPKCEVLYVKDAARAIELAIRKSENSGYHVYNIGAGVLTSSRDLNQALRNFFPEKIVMMDRSEHVPGGYYSPSFPSNFKKAKREFGYEPLFDLSSAIEDYLGYFRKLR